MSERSQARTAHAIRLMTAFAERTGLSSRRPQQRYLWTDAHAVCNFLGLASETRDPGYTELALRLVDRVHHTLGRHRPDDSRRGWLSGLGESEGEAHPTRGGLRIGKNLPERRPEERFDEQLEWERDGQYFHYLTKWMHALDQVARATGEPRYNLWARELAVAAYDAFSFLSPGAGLRMAWKMSIDLSRAQVRSMGQHDPLDGYITCVELAATAAQLVSRDAHPALRDERSGLAAMTGATEWGTVDPLGLGGLLIDAGRVAQLVGDRALEDDGLLAALLAAALQGLGQEAALGDLRRPASMRLAFRELGLAIGLRALPLIEAELHRSPERYSSVSQVRVLLEALRPYAGIAGTLESFWLDPDQQAFRSWVEHRDINEVMLATSLLPDGYLRLFSARPEQLVGLGR